MLSSKSPKISRLPLLVACIGLFANLCLAQGVPANGSKMPLLKPGEKVSGRDHPELFNRRVAFEMLLTLLSVQPTDAPYRQQRARTVEIKRIGLTLDDATQLEQIVETYRIQESAVNKRVTELQQTTTATHQDFLLEGRAHVGLMRQANAAINGQLSTAGRASLNKYLNEIISKSEIHSAAPQVDAAAGPDAGGQRR